MATYLNPKWIEGRKIIKARVHRYRAPDGFSGRLMHQPEFLLDNGALLRFSVEEHPEGAEYGINVIYVRPERAGEKKHG